MGADDARRTRSTTQPRAAAASLVHSSPLRDGTRDARRRRRDVRDAARPGTVPSHVRSMVRIGRAPLMTLAWLMILRATPTRHRQRAAQGIPVAASSSSSRSGPSICSLFAAVAVLDELETLPSAQVPVCGPVPRARRGGALLDRDAHIVHAPLRAHVLSEDGAVGCLQFRGRRRRTISILPT